MYLFYSWSYRKFSTSSFSIHNNENIFCFLGTKLFLGSITWSQVFLVIIFSNFFSFTDIFSSFSFISKFLSFIYPWVSTSLFLSLPFHNLSLYCVPITRVYLGSHHTFQCYIHPYLLSPNILNSIDLSLSHIWSLLSYYRFHLHFLLALVLSTWLNQTQSM